LGQDFPEDPVEGLRPEEKIEETLNSLDLPKSWVRRKRLGEFLGEGLRRPTGFLSQKETDASGKIAVIRAARPVYGDLLRRGKP
jgi:hypothetical protein